MAPPRLIELAKLWAEHGGVNLGIVGDARHLQVRESYHLGRDDLDANAYSRRTSRDRAGLTNAASAIDLGKLDGSYGNLQAFSAWLVAEARENKPGTGDMREIIYSPDGKAVLRWDRERGYKSVPKTGEADSTHLFHTHVSFYRDAENRDHRTAFVPYWEDNVIRFHAPQNEVGGTVLVKQLTQAIPLTGGERPAVQPGVRRPALGIFTLDDLGNRPCFLMLVGTGLAFVAASAVTFTPTPSGTVTAGDCSALEAKIKSAIDILTG